MVFDIYDYKLTNEKLYKVTSEYFNRDYYGIVSKDGINNDIWKGISYGYFADILFCLPVGKYYYGNSTEINDKQKLWVTFICRPGCKFNYLSQETIKQLGIDKKSTSSSFVVNIADIKTPIYSSEFNSSDEDVNIIGHEFLSLFDCKLILEYKDSSCNPVINSHE